MPNAMKTFSATLASMMMAAASLSATPAVAQTGSGTGGGNDPYACNFPEDYYSCCPRYEPCTQRWIGDAPLPPEPPSKPQESPEE